jgi:hypothetical protein
MPFGLSDVLALTVAYVSVEPQTILKLYIIASAKFLGQASAAKAPAWIPMSALRASWAQLISILRLLIREASPAPFAAAPSSGSWCRTVAPASAPDANPSVVGL